LNVFKATGKDTGGALALWESLIPRGSSPPLHVHFREDEAFYVLDGELTVRVGDQVLNAAAGSFIWGPRNVPHQFRVDSPTARLLTLFVPGGGEEMFSYMSRPAEALTLPPSSDKPLQMPSAELQAMLEERYGGKVLGPPMDRFR
jgi:quercetin dioxygenase-like cupin family protein